MFRPNFMPSIMPTLLAVRPIDLMTSRSGTTKSRHEKTSIEDVGPGKPVLNRVIMPPITSK